MITLIIGFLSTIILALIAPGKISLPFKKIKDAIRELQECNLDVSISYNQDDEVGEIAQEMNKMIRSFKTFDDLRADRINIENRKFDTLANMSNRPVLLASADGKLAYMNNFMFSLLQLKSEDVIGKDLKESILPTPLVDAFDLAMKRRSKVENIEMAIHTREAEVVEVVGAEVSNPEELSKDAAGGSKNSEQEGNLVYLGYANVIPIRAKESSLDYYLMVLSTETFA
jgi:nitrogen fixation/metabolism regulation signal transduction histidine kinase